MTTLLYANLSSGKLSTTLAGGSYRFPTLTQGDKVHLKLRLTERIEGDNVEVRRTVSTVKAGIGKVDAAPTSGTWALEVDAWDTPDLTYPFTAAELETALLSAGTTIGTPGDLTVEEDNGSFIIGYSSALTLAVAKNCLKPVAFTRFREWTCDGIYYYEIRFQQTAIAFTDSWDRVVPQAPYIVEVQEGSDVDGLLLPAVQHLHMPPDFRGTYTLGRDGKVSNDLSRENKPAEIAAALQPIAEDGGYFDVTVAYDGVAKIKFLGDMEGQDYDPLTVAVVDAPDGDVTFTLDLDTAELAALLRDTDEIVLPLEIELGIEDLNDDAIVRRTSFRTTVTIQEDLIREEDAAAEDIDWLLPRGPWNYVAKDASQVITGSQHFPFSLSGDGAVNHGLDTTYVDVTMVDSTGHMLEDSEYTVNLTSDDSLNIAFTGSPSFPVDGFVRSAGPVSAFVNGILIAIAQVIGLDATLADILSRLDDLEALSPTGVFRLTDEPDWSETWTLPPYFEVFPVIGDRSQLPTTGKIADFDSALLPKYTPPLFPAVIADADAATDLPLTNGKLITPPAGTAGTLYKNVSAAAVNIPRSSPVVSVDDPYGYSYPLQPGEFASHNGETWYALSRYGTDEDSFFATALERTLWQDTISANQLAAARDYEVRFAVELATLRANTPWHWHLAIELASVPAETSPGETGENLESQTFGNPIFTERLILQATPREYKFGFRVIRDSAGDLTAEVLSFGAWQAVTAPASAEFSVRARLIRADAANEVDMPRGFLLVSGFTADATDAVYGSATVRDS